MGLLSGIAKMVERDAATAAREAANVQRLEARVAAEAARSERAAAEAAAKEAKSVGHTQAIGSHGPKKGEWGAHIKPGLNAKTAAAAGVAAVTAQGVMSGHASSLGDLAEYVGHELGDLFGSGASGLLSGAGLDCEGLTGSKFLCENGLMIGLVVVGGILYMNIR